MKVDWIEFNKVFNNESANELKNISDYLIVSYIHTNVDDPIEHVGMLSFHTTSTGSKIGILDGHLYYDFFKWTVILKYCPIEV